MYKVLNLEMRPLCTFWCPQQMGKNKNEVLWSPWEIWYLSPRAFFLPGRAPTCNTSPGICYLPAELMEQQLGPWTQRQQPSSDPHSQEWPIHSQEVAPIPQKSWTSPSTDDDRILMGEASLKQRLIALNCMPQSVWLWDSSYVPAPERCHIKTMVWFNIINSFHLHNFFQFLSNCSYAAFLYSQDTHSSVLRWWI